MLNERALLETELQCIRFCESALAIPRHPTLHTTDVGAVLAILNARTLQGARLGRARVGVSRMNRLVVFKVKGRIEGRNERVGF